MSKRRMEEETGFHGDMRACFLPLSRVGGQSAKAEGTHLSMQQNRFDHVKRCGVGSGLLMLSWLSFELGQRRVIARPIPVCLNLRISFEAAWACVRTAFVGHARRQRATRQECERCLEDLGMVFLL